MSLASGFFIVEVKLLLARNGLAVFGGWVEGPLLNGGDDIFVDAVAKAGQTTAIVGVTRELAVSALPKPIGLTINYLRSGRAL